MANPQHTAQGIVLVHNVMLDRGQGVDTRQDYDGPCTPVVDIAGYIFHSLYLASHGRHFKPVEHTDRRPIGGGNEITAHHGYKQQDVEQSVGKVGRYDFPAGMAGQWAGNRISEPPDDPEQDNDKQQDPDTPVNIRRLAIPLIVVGQTDHVIAQPKQPEHGKGYQPMHNNTDNAKLAGRIADLHGLDIPHSLMNRNS